jgi:G:T/U-mismatch repair DNA glycosylase
MQDSIIHHQFLNKTFFYPTWKVDTLILGTFNPQCGESTDYFYGRKFNNFWRTIEKLLNIDEYYFQEKLDRKIEVMTKYKFGCTDVIKSIKLKDLSNKELICGKGYSDQVLFTKKI